MMKTVFFDGGTSQILFICFANISVFHLTQCFLEDCGPVNKRLADISKILLMPLLLSVLLSSLVMTYLPLYVKVCIISALIFSTAGDAALLFDSKKNFFILGMFFFALAQISYIVYSIFFLSQNTPPFGKTLVTGALFILGFLTVFSRIHKVLGNLKTAVFGYGILICAMSFLFVVSALAYPSAATVIQAAGSIVFIISDFMVAYSRFAGKIPKGRFFIMLTYILAQTMIAGGFRFFHY